jgi:D-alanyl-D-alanine carboxypeptidase (penicillin-binding protein 5/6)
MTTSAYDQSLIFKVAMQHEEFANAARTRKIDFPGYAGRAGFQVSNDNKLLGSYEGFLGGKTGFTDDSRHTYVGAAERDGRKLAVVLLRGEKNPASLGDQGASLLDYGFTLAAAETKPVGELVTQSPAAQPKPKPNPGENKTVDEPVDDKAAAAPAVEAERSAFGNVGLPLVALAGIGILVTFAMWLRRRRARIARANKAAG